MSGDPSPTVAAQYHPWQRGRRRPAATLAPAATIDPGIYPMVDVTGTATVAAIGACWTGNMITLRTAGALPCSNHGGTLQLPDIHPGRSAGRAMPGGLPRLRMLAAARPAACPAICSPQTSQRVGIRRGCSLSNGALSLGVADFVAGSVAFANRRAARSFSRRPRALLVR